MHTEQHRRPLSSAIAKILPFVLLAFPGAAFALDPLHPLGETNLQTIIGKFIAAFLGLLGSISLAMFIWGGFLYMTAAGNEEKVKRAKKTFLYSTLGLLISFGSYAILRFVLNGLIGGALGG